MNKELLKEILLDQRDYFFSKKELIDRDIKLDEFINSKQIILISGIRRCGKSSLLYLIKEKLNIDEKNILYFNFDDERLVNFEINDYNKLIELHIELFKLKNINNLVLFFDEIQNFKAWEKFLNRMYEKGLKIYVTGSNGNLLNSEIATALTGRNKIIELYPFSFKEYLSFIKIKIEDLNLFSSEKKALFKSYFNQYFNLGGFPLVLEEKNIYLIKNYYSDIFYRNIITRHNISQVEEMKLLGNYFITNVSKLFSYSKLQNFTKIKSLSSLKNYISYFEDSFLFFYLKKFDYSLNKQILNPKKIYVSDIAFNRVLGFKFSEDIGRLLENLVFIELKRRGKDIYYHKNKKECDFVIKDGLDIVEAIQVCKSLESGDGSLETKNREIDGLLDACKSYGLSEGLILTEDEEGEEIREVRVEREDKRLENGEGGLEIREVRIKIMPIWKWLLSKE